MIKEYIGDNINVNGYDYSYMPQLNWQFFPTADDEFIN